MKAVTMRRAYCREAAVMLAFARLAVRWLPSAWLFGWAGRPMKRIRRFAIDEADWIAWSVDHVGSRRRMTALCLPRALAAHAMLRRRGIASRLCLGVARNGGELAAHAWIEIGDKKIVGGDESVAFTQLAAFGGAK
ncbi:MAG: lasso peptide biosynthesis B2 protein [Pseudorhodoplanes sp.]